MRVPATAKSGYMTEAQWRCLVTTSVTHTKEFWAKKQAAIDAKTKICIGCKKEKDKAEYTTDNKHRDHKYPYCRECCKARAADLYKRKPDVYSSASSKWGKKNRHKVQAYNNVYKAILSGEIIKPKRCQKCDAKERLDAHHENGYEGDSALDVIFLCRRCHMAIHVLEKGFDKR